MASRRLLAASISAAAFAAGAAPPPLAIRNVTVIDGTGAAPRPGVTVVMKRGAIAAIGPEAPVPGGATVVDGTGKFLVPGLWDMHVHLALVDDPDVSRNVLLPAYLAHGIVGVRDMGGDPARLLELRAKVASGQIPGPEIRTPGPFIDGPGRPSPATRAVSTAAEARAAVRYLKSARFDFVKPQSNLDPEAHAALAGEARRLGMPVEGHIPEAVSARAAIAAGQRSVEHVSPILAGDAGLLLACSDREEELRAELLALRAARKDPEADRAALRARGRALRQALAAPWNEAKAAALFAELKRRNVHVVPTLVWARHQAPLSAEDRPDEWLLRGQPAAVAAKAAREWEAALGAWKAEDFARAREVSEISLRFVGALHLAGVPLLAGSDSPEGHDGPGTGLHAEIELLVAAGLTPMEALQAATRNPARFLGVEKLRGTLEMGKRADAVLLDADPLADIRNTRRIAGVVQGGRFWTREELTKLLPER